MYSFNAARSAWTAAPGRHAGPALFRPLAPALTSPRPTSLAGTLTRLPLHTSATAWRSKSKFLKAQKAQQDRKPRLGRTTTDHPFDPFPADWQPPSRAQFQVADDINPSRPRLPEFMIREQKSPPVVFRATPEIVNHSCLDILQGMGSDEFLLRLRPLKIAPEVLRDQLEAFTKRFRTQSIPGLDPATLAQVIVDQNRKSLEHRLCRAFLDHLLAHTPRSQYHTLGELPLLKRAACMKYPHEWYPAARRLTRKIIMHVGPTNSGKTHRALLRLESARRGIFCGPLRLLAHEIYERMNSRGIGCNLITGEDRRISERDVPLLAATIEMADYNTQFDVAVLDEIQMIGDTYRGYAWTDALLGLQASEIHLCGEPSAVPVVRRLVESVGDELEVVEYERLSRMEMAAESLGSNLTQLRRGDCIIAFSRAKIYGIKEYIEKNTTHKCSVIYGSLPPETRAQQARLFNDPTSENTVLVASDAVGMGINLSIGRIIFTSSTKFNGVHVIELGLSSARQIAGRAGRYGTEFNPGYVTAVLDQDMEFLRRTIPTLPPTIPRAVAKPPVHLLERFAHQLPEVPFTQMLEIFEMVSDLGDALFTLGDVGVTSEEFDFLDSLNMTVGDKFMMTFAPLAKGSDYAKALTQKMIGFHASGRECRIADLFIMPSTAPVTSTELHIFEQYHKVLTCYLWLSFKFPATYIDYPVALETKAKCEELIEKGLDNMKRLGRGKVRWAPSRSNSKTSESFKSRLLAEPTVVPVETEATLMRST